MKTVGSPKEVRSGYDEFLRNTKQRSETEFFLDQSISNKELLFNPDCNLGIILDYILQTVGIPKDLKDSVDLAEDDGKLLEVRRKAPSIDGLDILDYDKFYYLVIIEDDVPQPLLAVPLVPKAQKVKHSPSVVSSSKVKKVESVREKLKYEDQENVN